MKMLMDCNIDEKTQNRKLAITDVKCKKLFESLFCTILAEPVTLPSANRIVDL